MIFKDFSTSVLVIAIALCLSCTRVHAQYPSFTWARIAISDGADNFSDVAVDQAGNVYAVGYFELDLVIGTDTFPHPVQGNSDAMLVKFDENGNYIWGQQLGGPGSQEAYNIEISPQDEIYITGRIAGNAAYMGSTGGVPQYLSSGGGFKAYISKFDLSGELLWTRLINGTSFTWSNAIAFDTNNDILITGTYWPDADFGNGIILTSSHQMDLYVARYTPNGVCTWAISEGGHNADWSYDIAVDSNGNFAIAGSFDDTLNLSGNTLIAKGNGDAFVAFYNNGGALQWYHHAGGFSTQTVTSDAARRLAFDSDDNLWVTGFYQDTILFGADTLFSTGFMDIYIVKFNGNGLVLQTKSLGGASLHDVPADIAIDQQNNIYLAGSAYYTITVDDSTYYTHGMNDVMVMKFNPAGQLQWFKHGGSPYNDGCGRIALNSNAEVYVTGSFGDKSPIVLDTITLAPTGTEQWYEAVVAKISWINEPSFLTNETHDITVTLFPNPAKDFVYINGYENATSLKIYNVLGDEIFSDKVPVPGKIDVTGYSKGLYVFFFPELKKSVRVIVD